MVKLTIDPRMEAKWASYPTNVLPQLLHLRTLIVAVAEAAPTIASLEETLKWGEPSYLAPKGSTLRLDWKAKHPDQYALYFKCTSQLIPTIKALYGDLFEYETTRALVFQLEAPLPEVALKHCIALALRYHSLKHEPLLGQQPQ